MSTRPGSTLFRTVAGLSGAEEDPLPDALSCGPGTSLEETPAAWAARARRTLRSPRRRCSPRARRRPRRPAAARPGRNAAAGDRARASRARLRRLRRLPGPGNRPGFRNRLASVTALVPGPGPLVAGIGGGAGRRAESDGVRIVALRRGSRVGSGPARLRVLVGPARRLPDPGGCRQPPAPSPSLSRIFLALDQTRVRGTIMPALNTFSDSCLLVSRVKLRVRWPFLVIALFRAVLRRHPACPAVSVTTAVCRLAPGATQASATRLPGR